MKKYIFTSESVGEGHPDKVCDQISDALLDVYLSKDRESRVAIECLIKDKLIVIAGEVTSKSKINIKEVVNNVLKKVGYYGEYKIISKISKQSQDIAVGVDEKDYKEQGAGDQGFMFGYASNETSELMPLPIILAHKLVERLSKIRNENILTYLKSDAKSQVSIEYEDNKVKRIDTIVISSQHDENIEMDKLKKDIFEYVIKPICGDLIDKNTKIYINPTGRFVKGGSEADAGVTGRKIIVDSYGGMGRHGGGAFSGKDPSKVDRSGAYITRYIAKNIVGAKLADKCEVGIGYAIGIAQPVSLYINCFGTNKISEEEIIERLKPNISLKPKDIIDRLDLKKPIYLKTACFGHFGRDEFNWEKLDLAEKIK